MANDVREKFINGMPESDYKAYEALYKGQHLAQKGIQVGGTNGAGGVFGSAWLNDSGFWQAGNGALKAKIEDLGNSSVIMACCHWIMRNTPSASIVVAQKNPDGTMGEIQAGHEMTRLIERPTQYPINGRIRDVYSGKLLRQAKTLSFTLDGNAFWLKVRNGGGHGKPVQLWYEPHFTIRPRYNGNMLIDYYEIYRKGEWLRVEVEDVVHFRFGLDPNRPLMGLSPLAAALRLVFTDEEALIYTAAMLKNMGVPPMIVSPESSGFISNPEEIKRLLMEKTGGAHRGEPLVWSEALKIMFASFDPKNMNANESHRISEERITALIGVNRMVAGLGPDPTYANMEQAREGAFEENIIPTNDLMADDLTTQLLPDFTDDPNLAVFYSYAGVRVLAEDEVAKTAMVMSKLAGGGISLNDMRKALGDELVPEAENVWYIPQGVKVAKSPMEAIAAPMPMPEPPTTEGDPFPPVAEQKPPQAPESAPKALKGALDTKGKKDTAESISADIEKATAAAIERVYKKAESAVGK